MPIVNCEMCGKEVDPDNWRTRYWKAGWARRRQEGGVNQLELAIDYERWACEECIAKAKRGISSGQGSLI